MILNLIRTISQLGDYFGSIRYPMARILVYSVVSIVAGIWLSNSPKASDLPILTVTAILFGFTINAVVMLGNSSEHYLSSKTKHSDQLKHYYEKSLYISIHTLGIGISTIVITGIYQLFPDFNLYLFETQLKGHLVRIELISAVVYSFLVYYLIVFTTVIASVAELVKIRV